MGQNIDVIHAFDFLFGCFQQWMAGHNASIIDNDRNKAMFLLHLVSHFQNFCTINNVYAARLKYKKNDKLAD